jgi:5-methylcytosine-specific restriction endonuclease McrA
MNRAAVDPTTSEPTTSEPTTTSDWRTAHAALSRLARQRAAADAEEGRWLLAAQRAAAHVHLGFGCFAEYAERLFGYKPRSTFEKLRVAAALESLPELASALETGSLSWSAVRELTRVAVAETEQEWLELALGKSLRQLEELVAGRHPGDAPSAPPDPSALRHVLRFEVTAETFALVREALAELRRRSDAALNDDAALLEMARHVLVGPRDEGRSSYQIALSLCPGCSSAQLAANGQLVPVGPEVLEKAECDAQHLPPLEADTAPAPNDSPEAGSRAATNPSAHRGTRAGARTTTNPSAHRGTRAQQDIPPATRRAVLHRDHHRCRIPGCRNATFLDLHHLQLREDGGAHEPANLIAVCSAHHGALHEGRLRTEGDAASLRILHADGSAYGQPREPRNVEVQTKVFAGLRGLGFREADVRAVMAELRERAELREASAEQWLRAALLRLHRSAPVRR